jgi:predicted deacetylase
MTLLLSLHDVTPGHAGRLGRADGFFEELGVSRVTYLLVPRYHRAWAVEADAGFQTWCRAARRFSVRWCLHGFLHQEFPRVREASVRNWAKRRLLTAGEGEFLALRRTGIAARLDRGARAFAHCLGEQPTGFVAPAWLFNADLAPALRARGFRWTEDHRHMHDLSEGRALEAPVITWASRTPLRRRGSVWLAGRLLRRWHKQPILRLAVHPFDFDYPDIVESIARTIETARRHRRLRHYEETLEL